MNLLKIPAKDAYSYGRSLLFSKEEQKGSVIFKTKKSEKPPLSPRRVEKMFGKYFWSIPRLVNLILFLLACIESKYKDCDRKRLLNTLGQKCRDAKLDN